QLAGVQLWHEVHAAVRGRFPDAAPQRLKYQTISALIGIFIDDLTTETSRRIAACGITSVDDLRRVNTMVAGFSDELTRKNRELKLFLLENLYHHYKVERMRVKAERYLANLFQTYAAYPTLLPVKYLKKMELFGRERVICDYIAGMTDRFALDEYKRLFEPYERV
ncbi:MAG: putative deoxyguanosine triphosphate triphosphohydrolase, partial [Deltaproteobacteria bacterium]|nr:putative deoxyguanosine triphosphate triphosphohydrolase [Deltaproteobacteria bacterium]